jgi:hypothetical protein
MPMSYELLAFQADVLDDLERVRVANQNRLRQLTRTGSDKDGLERGFGMDESDPDVARLTALVDALKQMEHDAERNLCRALRAHPLGPWVKSLCGVGEKQGARLIASIGDPYWHPDGRPRQVSELWSLCGYGDPVAQRRARGQKMNWNPAAKMRAHLVAESCIKHRQSPFRPVYDQARKHYADATHATPCVRCGPPGHPAAAGTPLSDGHKHARALRAVSKELLLDLWRAGRALHRDT